MIVTKHKLLLLYIATLCYVDERQTRSHTPDTPVLCIAALYMQ